MQAVTILDFVTLFFAGMLAGIEFVIHYGLRGPSELLDERAQLQLRQALVLRLRVLVPTFFVPTAVFGIVVTLLNSATPGFVFRCAAVLALSLWILIRVVGTVPINSATADWKELVNRAERFHSVGVWAAVLAFAFFLTAVAFRLVVH
jgi:hypothetical protein